MLLCFIVRDGGVLCEMMNVNGRIIFMLIVLYFVVIGIGYVGLDVVINVVVLGFFLCILFIDVDKKVCDG